MSEPQTNAYDFTVSEISGAIKQALENGFGHVRVRGEVSKVSRPGSGHLYFDLKDDRSVLSAVAWKGTVARWRIERDYQELKQELGLGHYEGRNWRGFHHHASLCIEAYGFLMLERLSGRKKRRSIPSACPTRKLPAARGWDRCSTRSPRRSPRAAFVWPVRSSEPCACAPVADAEGRSRDL